MEMKLSAVGKGEAFGTQPLQNRRPISQMLRPYNIWQLDFL